MWKPVREQRVLDWIAANSDELVLSSIVLAELRFYVAKQIDGRRKTFVHNLLTAIDASVGKRFANFDAIDASVYGDLMAAMRRAGTPIPVMDGLVAAQAMARCYAVGTRNVKDFLPTGVEVINPWDA